MLFLNINPYLPNSIGTTTVVSHETRALFDAKQYHKLHHPIILPKARLGELIKDQLQGLEILDYGLTLQDDSFKIGPKSCILQWPLAAAYAFAVVTQAGASKINLVGFDGYPTDDPRHKEMSDVFFEYTSLEESLNITALTPTAYHISQGSIFSPIIS